MLHCHKKNMGVFGKIAYSLAKKLKKQIWHGLFFHTVLPCKMMATYESRYSFFEVTNKGSSLMPYIQFLSLKWPHLVISETAALQLGTDRGFMDRLVGWCEVDEHAGVQGKAQGGGRGLLSTLTIL